MFSYEREMYDIDGALEPELLCKIRKKNSWEDLQICYLTWYPQHSVPDKYWCFLSISEITASKCISNFIIWVSK